MGDGDGSNIGSVIAAGHRPKPGELEFTIDAVIINTADPKEADVYLTNEGKPYPYSVRLNPKDFNDGIKKGNTLVAAVDGKQRILAIITIYEKNKPVYTVTEHT